MNVLAASGSLPFQSRGEAKSLPGASAGATFSWENPAKDITHSVADEPAVPLLTLLAEGQVVCCWASGHSQVAAAWLKPRVAFQVL